MKTFSYGDVEAYSEEKERRERWNRATIPLIILGIFIIGWVAYGALMVNINSFTLDGYIETTGEVKNDGIHYRAERKGIVSDYRTWNHYNATVGETIVMYYKADKPHTVYIPHEDYTWMLAFPLAVLTLLDLWWLFKMMTPKKKHYIPDEKKENS